MSHICTLKTEVTAAQKDSSFEIYLPPLLSWPVHVICNLGVVGSNPSGGSIIKSIGEIPERSNGADCNSAASAT